MSLRTRLAPTPSGWLHIGNAISFVVTWALARAQAGWILLRIDDLDTGRRRPEYLEDIFQTLDWLGIDYDEGPEGPDEFLRSYSQQLRLPLYREALNTLRIQGDLYACTCSRKQIRAVSADGRYPGTCKGLSKAYDAPGTAWRVGVPAGKVVEFAERKYGLRAISLDETMGDFVVRQKNGKPAYQIASLVDDVQWKINFVVRGEDLLPSTAAQLYLAELRDYSTFGSVTFWHHGLITGADGQKLSKSQGADAVKHWRTAGQPADPIFQAAAHWLGIREGPVGNAGDLLSVMKEMTN